MKPRPRRPHGRALPASTAPGKLHVTDIMRVKETAPAFVNGYAERTRAFVEVQNGCDHRCTFCIIPYGPRQRPLGADGRGGRSDQALVDQGYAEVVLTGVDLTSYGPDLPGSPKLGDLVQQILRHVPDLQRLRLSSIDHRGRPGAGRGDHRRAAPDAASASLAAGRRRYDPEAHEAPPSARGCHRVSARTCAPRGPDIVFGADIIAGFPTETEAMFENSLIWSRPAASPSCTSSRSPRARARPPPACPSWSARSSSTGRAPARQGPRGAFPAS
jgi:threonylcarbamoyladenosine tRNA methylthiotransferase MtaB